MHCGFSSWWQCRFQGVTNRQALMSALSQQPVCSSCLADLSFLLCKTGVLAATCDPKLDHVTAIVLGTQSGTDFWKRGAAAEVCRVTSGAAQWVTCSRSLTLASLPLVTAQWLVLVVFMPCESLGVFLRPCTQVQGRGSCPSGHGPHI